MKTIRILIVSIIFAITFAANCWAVVVTGTGTTKEEAINNGLREAVEQFTSTFVYGVTDVENYQLQKDQLVAASLGYVKRYRIIKSSNIDDLIVLTLDVTLSEDKIESIFRDNINMITYEDVLRDYNNVTQRQDQIRKLIKMLHIMARRPIHEKYGVVYDGYEIKRISATTVDTVLSVRITQNPFYHKAYNEILKNLSEPTNSSEVTLVAGNYKIQAGHLTNSKYYISGEGINRTDLYSVCAQIHVNGVPVDQCREYQDNLMYVFSTGKFVKGFVKLFPSEFKKAWNGDETPIDDKWDNYAIQGSKIIPPEGFPLKVKYMIRDSDGVKGLRDLKLSMGVCKEDRKVDMEAMKKKKERAKAQRELLDEQDGKPKKELKREYRNKSGALVIDDSPWRR